MKETNFYFLFTFFFFGEVDSIFCFLFFLCAQETGSRNFTKKLVRIYICYSFFFLFFFNLQEHALHSTSDVKQTAKFVISQG